MLEIPRLSTHLNRGVQVEGQLICIIVVGFSSGFGLDEAAETVDVFELCVVVQEKGGVVCVCESDGVEFSELGDEIVYALCVQELQKCT
jgi:hypothetical protein